MAITSAMATSYKQELLTAGHCHAATVTPTGTAASGSTSVTAVSSITGICLGMRVSGTNIAANTLVAAIPTTTTLTLSIAATGVITNGTLTIAGDLFKMALFKANPTNTYGAATTNYSQMTEELTTAGGYTVGGVSLGNVNPASLSTTAYTSFAPDPSWAAATFSTDGCMIYNSSARIGTTTGRCVSVHYFGSTQVSAGGTYTVVMPANDGTNSLLQLR